LKRKKAKGRMTKRQQKTKMGEKEELLKTIANQENTIALMILAFEAEAKKKVSMIDNIFNSLYNEQFFQKCLVEKFYNKENVADEYDDERWKRFQNFVLNGDDFGYCLDDLMKRLKENFEAEEEEN
tara:strand:- start:108 stop:485 length:378 start_codon:yes stop_codon:yes gene_type:complete